MGKSDLIHYLASSAEKISAGSKFYHQELPKFFLITDHKIQKDALDIIAKLPREAGVIFRDYDIKEREKIAARVAKICRKRGLTLLIAGDAGLATKLNADGVHFPEKLAAKAMAIKRKFPRMLVTVSAHDEKTVKKLTGKVDAVFLSAVFPTRSHPGIRTLGLLRLARIAKANRVAIYALGGINKNSVMRLKESGIAGIATIRGVME